MRFKVAVDDLKNNENDVGFVEIWKKKEEKIKIKFQKIKATFWNSIPWVKSHQPPMIPICIWVGEVCVPPKG